MLDVQHFLLENELERLTTDFGIRIIENPDHPLVILNYSQINSPKYNSVVKECRGLVLEKDTWKVVAKAFDRFYNWGEGEINFDWGSFEAYEKADGTLCILYHYAGRWWVNTRQTFNLAGDMWYDLFWATASFTEDDLDPALTYCFELCTPQNALVTKYESPRVYLLGSFYKTGDECNYWPPKLNPIPVVHLDGEDRVKAYITAKEKSQPDFEGLVLKDVWGTRLKVKTKTYLNYHHLFENGNMLRDDRLIPLLLAGEGPNLNNIFPAYSSYFEKTEEMLRGEFDKVSSLWDTYGDLPRKDFAKAVLPHTAFSFALFKKKDNPAAELEDIWFDGRGNVAKIIAKRS